MAGDVGQAFVRIRPNTAGFAAETEAGVKGAFSSIGKHLTEALGVAFGLKTGFDFTKGIVTGAADIQKQIEAVKNEFGDASTALLDFSNKGAVDLGISARTADTASAKFGLLFRGLGIGQKQAGLMTLEFEKLAGSIATIQNRPVADILAAVPAAIAGSTRGLKTLGVAVDSNTLKLAALKLGLITSLKEPLSAATRTVAIFSLATGRLPELEAQAAAHSGDLADQTAKLAAEWSNAKDRLGTELLPVVTRLATYLANHLPGAITTVIKDMREFAGIMHEVLGPIGGVKGAIGTLVGAFAVGKVLEFAKAIRVQLVQNGIKLYGEEALRARTTYVGAMGTMELATIGLGATIRGALISTGIGALIVAAGFAAQYVITHWQQVSQVLQTMARQWQGVFNLAWQAVEQGAKAAAFAILETFTGELQIILSLASHLPFVGKYAKEALDAIQGEINKFSPDFSKVTADFGAAGTEAGQAFANGAAQAAAAGLPFLQGSVGTPSGPPPKLVKDWLALDPNLASTVKAQTALTATQKAINSLTAAQEASIRSARNSIANLQSDLAQSIVQEGIDVADAINQAKSNLQSIMSTLSGDIGQIVDAPLNALQNRLNLQQNKLTLENLRRSVLLPGGKTLSTDPEKALAQLRHYASSAGTISRASVQAFLVQYQQAYLGVQQAKAGIQKQKIDIRLGNLSAALNDGRLNAKQFAAGLRAELKRDGVNMKTVGTLLGNAFKEGLRGTLYGAILQAGAIKIGPQSKAPYDVPGITYPLRVLQQDQRDIARKEHDLAVKQNSLTAKISGYSKRIAKATEKAAALQEELKQLRLNKALARNPGHQSQITHELSGGK